MAKQRRVAVRTSVILDEKPKKKKRKDLPIVALCGLFLVALVIVARTRQGGLPAIPGVTPIQNVAAPAPAQMPDHLSTPQMLEWTARCQANQASQDDCTKLNWHIKAKIEACQSRMDSQGGNWQQFLVRCDERFPDLR